MIQVIQKITGKTLFDTTPLDSLPKESLADFKQMVLTDGLKPSVALRAIMEKFKCTNPHVTTVVQLLKFTYPHIDFGSDGFRFRIVDSAYPNSDPNQFSDEDFDKGIEEFNSNPPEW